MVEPSHGEVSRAELVKSLQERASEHRRCFFEDCEADFEFPSLADNA